MPPYELAECMAIIFDENAGDELRIADRGGRHDIDRPDVSSPSCVFTGTVAGAGRARLLALSSFEPPQCDIANPDEQQNQSDPARLAARRDAVENESQANHRQDHALAQGGPDDALAQCDGVL